MLFVQKLSGSLSTPSWLSIGSLCPWKISYVNCSFSWIWNLCLRKKWNQWPAEHLPDFGWRTSWNCFFEADGPGNSKVLIICRSDYWNMLQLRMSVKMTQELQVVQNSTAHLQLGKRHFSSTTSMLWALQHWFPPSPIQNAGQML